MEHYNIVDSAMNVARIHKARPSTRDAFHCAVCHQTVKRVPGGQGPTYVHAETGAVVAHGVDPRELTHRVYCHACPIDAPFLARRDAILHGSNDFGGLWHCAEHAHCSYCAHDPEYCDDACDQGKRRHNPNGERGR